LSLDRDENIEATIKELREDDLIEVHFVDASITWNVNAITDQRAWCRYKTLRGRFWCVEWDNLYGISHLIMKDAGEDTTLIVIPVPMIGKILPLDERRTRLSQVSNVGSMMLSGNYVKIIERFGGIGEEEERS